MVDQTDLPSTEATAAPDLDAIHQQTQPAALQGLDDASLAALLRDLRAMKAAAGAVDMQKALAQSIRRAVAEKRQRHGDDAGASAQRLDKAAAKAGKAEEKARKEAERAERKRVKEAERAEKKAAKAALKGGADKLAETRDKARAKKLAKLGKPKAEKPKAAKDKAHKDKAAKDKDGNEKPIKDKAARIAARQARPAAEPVTAEAPAFVRLPEAGSGEDES